MTAFFGYHWARCDMTVELETIRTEADYEAALAEAEGLWGAKNGTPESDRLDRLATLIDACEALYHPVDPPTSVDAIRFRAEQLGLTKSGS
jgi:HTH-type transcriptional regulator/antitoxin HigA